MSTSLYTEIYALVQRVPLGYVTSYREIAKALGLISGARTVGWALRSLAPDTATVPWHRIIAKDGRISIINPHIPPSLQAQRLLDEGSDVIEINGWLTVNTPKWFYFVEQ